MRCKKLESENANYTCFKEDKRSKIKSFSYVIDHLVGAKIYM